MYVVFAGGSIFLGILPWYSWFIGLFSIPTAILDVLGAATALALIFYVYAVIPLVFQLFTMPFFLFMAVFGEIILISLAPFTPFLFIVGIIGWIVGEI